VGYFHVVFTIPQELNPFALRNKKVFYDIMFRAPRWTEEGGKPVKTENFLNGSFDESKQKRIVNDLGMEHQAKLSNHNHLLDQSMKTLAATQDGGPVARSLLDLRNEVEARVKQGLGPVTPDGDMGEEKYRLVVEGPPNYTSFRDFWKMFYDEGAVVVASSYTKVGGVYDFGFRHDPDHPLESLADYCLGVYTNRNLPERVNMLTNYVEEYQADGLLVNSIKSCNSFSAGQLLIMREVEKRTGKPAAFIETDLVDPRYFSPANVKNRLESYFQMVEQKRAGKQPAVGAMA